MYAVGPLAGRLSFVENLYDPDFLARNCVVVAVVPVGGHAVDPGDLHPEGVVLQRVGVGRVAGADRRVVMRGDLPPALRVRPLRVEAAHGPVPASGLADRLRLEPGRVVRQDQGPRLRGLPGPGHGGRDVEEPDQEHVDADPGCPRGSCTRVTDPSKLLRAGSVATGRLDARPRRGRATGPSPGLMCPPSDRADGRDSRLARLQAQLGHHVRRAGFQPRAGCTAAQLGPPSFPAPGNLASRTSPGSAATRSIISHVMPPSGTLSLRPHPPPAWPADLPMSM